MSQFKIGDKVNVSPTVTGLGEELIGIISKVETFLGRTLISVDYIKPDQYGGRGICVNACHVKRCK